MMLRTWLVLFFLVTAFAGVDFASAQTCGDGSATGGEECDDGNTVGGDGCAANCTLETDQLCELVQGSSKILQASFFTLPVALSGQLALTVGGVRSDRPADPVPFVIRRQSVHIALSSIAGIGTSCTVAGEIPGWGPDNAGGGLIDCGTTRVDGINVTTTLDSGAAQPTLMVQHSGMGPMGSVSFEIGVMDYTILDSAPGCVAQPGTGPPEDGADAIPCTEDDPAATAAEAWYGSSASETARVLNANGSASPIQATASGLPINCAELDGAGMLSGAKLVAALPMLDLPQLGDAVESLTLVCGAAATVPTPTPRIIPTCVPTPTPTPPLLTTPTATATPTAPPSTSTATSTAAGVTATPTAAAPSTSTPTAVVPSPAASIPATATAPAPTATVPPTSSPTEPPVTPTVSSSRCPGDCDGNGTVNIDDIKLAVNIVLGDASPELCKDAFGDTSHAIAIDDLVRAVVSAHETCPG